MHAHKRPHTTHVRTSTGTSQEKRYKKNKFNRNKNNTKKQEKIIFFFDIQDLIEEEEEKNKEFFKRRQKILFKTYILPRSTDFSGTKTQTEILLFTLFLEPKKRKTHFYFFLSHSLSNHKFPRTASAIYKFRYIT